MRLVPGCHVNWNCIMHMDHQYTCTHAQICVKEVATVTLTSIDFIGPRNRITTDLGWSIRVSHTHQIIRHLLWRLHVSYHHYPSCLSHYPTPLKQQYCRLKSLTQTN